MTSLNTHSDPIILEMRSITKEFPGVKALAEVNLRVKAGEIHAICGENGAGKSTLMKVLSGVYPFGSYTGDIVYQSEVQQFKDIRASEHAGIVIIHQELALIPELSIMENIFLGNEPTKRGVIDWAEARIRSTELLARVGLREDPDTPIKEIGVGKQQLVEIAKALNKSVKLLILDEPTAALNESDSQHLLDLMLGLKGRGITSIIISHKLNEIEQIADSITIIRDGKSIETLNVKADGVDEDRIIKGMVGRTLESRFPDHEPKIGEVFFEVKNWNVGHPQVQDRMVCKNSNFFVRRGEIVGFAGLMGAGRTELARSVFGRSYGRFLSGQVYKDGKEDAAQERPPGDRRRPGLRHRGPQVPRAEPAGRHQGHHGLGQPAQGQQAQRDRRQQGIHRRRGVPQVAADQGALRGGGRRQALRRQPAEGGAGEVDVHRP